MSDKELQRYRHYESMIKKARKTGIGEKPPSCAKCQYYQPDFKYRKCLYARCPYQRDTEIFRKRPLKKDKIPGPEVVKMDAAFYTTGRMTDTVKCGMLNSEIYERKGKRHADHEYFIELIRSLSVPSA